MAEFCCTLYPCTSEAKFKPSGLSGRKYFKIAEHPGNGVFAAYCT